MNGSHNLNVITMMRVFLVVTSLFCLGSFARAQHETVIYSFGANAGDGIDPEGGLIADSLGNLYGTTFEGGQNGYGTVFELSPPTVSGPWIETVLYSFTGTDDGANPIGSLIFDATGSLYGTAMHGGNLSCASGGCGTIFALAPPSEQGVPWTETTIHRFAGASDGADPNGGLVFDRNGNLYGSTTYGGSSSSLCSGPPISGCGTVFQLVPPAVEGGQWASSVLYSFTDGDDGGFPEAPVIVDDAGNVYGTTFSGGNVTCDFAACGTVFELVPTGETWAETVIHNFGSIFEDGFSPRTASLVLTRSGALVGTTPEGGNPGNFFQGGVVFGMLQPSNSTREWTYAVLYAFGQFPDDADEPLAGVTYSNDALYGTTFGGSSKASGCVFQLTPEKLGVWKESALYSFDGGSNGGFPAAPLLIGSGGLYGTTESGGTANRGTAFRITH